MIVRIPQPVYEVADAAGGASTQVAAAAADTIAAGTGDDNKAANAAGSALDLPANDKPIAAPADFPDDWRVKMAGGDKDAAKRLDRFKTPGDVFKSYTEIEKKVTGGKTAVTAAPDGEKDPEALKAWRKDNGIPDDPTGYELPKPVQERMSDADKPILASFTEFAHKKNLPPSAVAAAAEWYVEGQEAAFETQRQNDAKAAEETQDELRKDYGQEFRGNVTMAKRFAEEITPGVNWFEARLADGRKLGNIPDFVKALVDLGSQKYGDVAFAGGEASSRTATELETIQNLMDTDFAKYDGDPAMKKRYGELLAAQEKRGKR